MEPSYVFTCYCVLILYVNAQVGLYYMKLWHGQYVVREMMHNPVSFIDVGRQVSTATAGDLL